MLRELMDVVMGISCCSGSFAWILLSFIVDSTGTVPQATLRLISISWILLIVSAAVFGCLAVLRMILWAMSHRRGEKRGIMTSEEICACMRRMKK